MCLILITAEFLQNIFVADELVEQITETEGELNDSLIAGDESIDSHIIEEDTNLKNENIFEQEQVEIIFCNISTVDS